MFRIVLADDHPVFRAGAARILAADQECRIVAQCANLEQTLQAITAHRGSVALIASSLKPLLAKLRSHLAAAGSRGIILAEPVEQAQTYAAFGFQGVVYRDSTAEAFMKCVRRVVNGSTSIQQSSDAQASLQESEVGVRIRDRLTRREVDVVALVSRGLKNKEIALSLDTSEQVVKNYLRSIFDKVGVSDRLELALFTHHHGALAAAAAGRMTSVDRFAAEAH